MPARKRKQEDLTDEYALLSRVMDIGGRDIVREGRLFQSSYGSNVQKKAATDFSLQEAVAAFGLQYREDFSLSQSWVWNIQDIPETKGFELTPCLASLVENYSKNFDRSSKAVCRTVLNFILNECLTVMKNNHAKSGDKSTDQCSRDAPTPFDDIKVFGEVSFSHSIIPTTNMQSAPHSSYLGTVINGCVDHGIGRVLMSCNNYRKCRFQSLLLVVGAKTAQSLEKALPQLVVYLASLHQSRLSRNRSDASVYGVVSDGYLFTFVTIMHDGTLKQSKQFDIRAGDIVMVLGCLKHLLEMSASMSPNLSLDRNDGQLLGVDIGEAGEDRGDPAFDLNDNKYTNPLQDDEDDE